MKKSSIKKTEASSQYMEETKIEIPTPKSPNGFQKGYEAEGIIGSTEINDEILFLIKW